MWVTHLYGYLNRNLDLQGQGGQTYIEENEALKLIDKPSQIGRNGPCKESIAQKEQEISKQKKVKKITVQKNRTRSKIQIMILFWCSRIWNTQTKDRENGGETPP